MLRLKEGVGQGRTWRSAIFKSALQRGESITQFTLLLFQRLHLLLLYLLGLGKRGLQLLRDLLLKGMNKGF